MPQVPYNPDPEVSPQQIAQPKLRVDAPLAAFGGATAEAMQGLGKTVEGAGNEMFARAVALQQLDNESEARDADAKYMIHAGELHANFNALAPGERAAAYPKYQADLEKGRQDFRNGLSNPAAQRMYDSSSLSTMSRSIFNGAGAAASGTREFYNQTLSSSIDLNNQVISDNPGDEGLFQQKLTQVKQDAIKLAAGKFGADENSPVTQDLVLKAQSKAVLSRIAGLAKQNKVDDAQKFYDNNKGMMREDDANKASDLVATKTRSVTSANIADDVWAKMGRDEEGKPQATLADMEAEAEKQMKAKTDDPLAIQAAKKAVQSRYYVSNNAIKQQQIQDFQDVNSIITDQKPKDLNDFLTQPGAQELYGRLKPTDQRRLPGMIANYHQKVDQYDNAQEFNRIRGMQYTQEGRQELMDMDPYSLKLSQSQIGQVIKMRGDLIQKGQADPHVERYFNQLRRTNGQELEALGVYSRGQNKDEFDHFQAETADAIHEWLQTKKSMPTAEDFQTKIAPTLLKQIQQPGRFFGTNEFRTFNLPVPDNLHEEITVNLKRAKGGAEPTEDDITRFYHRQLYRSAFESMKDQDRAPAVPQSR